MTLPDNDATLWPPPAHQDIHDTIRRWNAWYEGDREKLAQVYGGAEVTATHRRNGVAHRGGLVGTATRLFWGTPVSSEQQSTRLHVPAAADIAQTSAELLFSEPPTLTTDQAAQARIDELFGPQMWDRLLDAASLQAGLGGVFLRAGWDRDRVPDRPLMDVIGPDYAVPRFSWGKLVEVTFTWILPGEQGTVVRHLEHHSPGRIEHGLFIGSNDRIGRRVPLEEHPDTAHLGKLVDAESSIATGLDKLLTVVYVPNRTATAWRGDPVGSNLGQADIAIVERAGMLDALDESYTSWQRDVRLAKARLVTSQAYLQTTGPGGGGLFDTDQELFVGLNNLPGGDKKPVELIQAEIRWEAHQATCKAGFERVVDGSGYSAQTFGLTGDVAITATESNARERKTNRTRSGKARDWSRAIPDLAELLLAIEQKHLGGQVAPVRPDVEFPPTVRDSIETLARTVSMLDGSASTTERVRLLHPTWTQKQIDDEVALIADERAVLTPIDPFAPTVDGPADGTAD